MKKRKIYPLLLLAALLLGSCELDNYDGPNATIAGSILDYETHELVEQDILRGTQIEYIEHGFSNPETQYMVIKNDGTYRNNLMFANTYTIQPVRGNFVPMEAEDILVKGNTQKDFYVQPYIRIKNARIEKVGDKIVATFNVQTTVPNNVVAVGLFAHVEPNVGSTMYQSAIEIGIHEVVDEERLFTLEMNLPPNNPALTAGKQYYFRVGALIDASEAKYNYVPAVRISI